MSQAPLDVLNPRLERGHVLLQHGEVALEDLAPALFVGECRLDPAQPLRDRVVPLLEPLESPVDLVEVPEHLTPEFGDLVPHLGDLAAHLVEPATDFGEPAVGRPKFGRVLGSELRSMPQAEVSTRQAVKRVLLVEDDRFLRRACEASLCWCGLTVLCAQDGEEGLRLGRTELRDRVAQLLGG